VDRRGPRKSPRVHPILFEIPTPWFRLPVYTYGVMLGTSMIVAWYFVMWLGRSKEGMLRDQLANAFIITAVVALVGSRVLFIATVPDLFPDVWSWFAIRRGGLVAYGGFLGGLLGSWIYWRNKQHTLLHWADVVAPTLGLGLFFTRIGCYFYGCDFGAPLGSDAPAWLRDLGTFPGIGGGDSGDGSPAFIHHVQQYGHAPTSHASLPVHPTQLYESAIGLALFGITMFLWRKRRFRGQVVLMLAMLYSAWRFAIEYLRDDPERGGAYGFSTSQYISLAIFPVAAFLYFQLRKAQGDRPIEMTILEEPDAKKEATLPGTKEIEAPKRAAPKRKKRKKA
jgi:phosphatidylglycerol---prolipoprotein diacylglyceryl transferase